MKNTIKSLILRLTPDLYYRISSYRFFRYCKRRFGRFQTEFAHCIFCNGEIKVLSGPFKGMRYFNRVVWGPITPKWIGSYEAELSDIINEIIRVKYEKILDVGAAEGYYAVGFSRSSPSAEVQSYDVDPIARKRQQQLALLNSIDNLSIGKYCSHDTLIQALNTRSLLFCDIEGFECKHLNPEVVSKLKETDILVEVHNYGALTSTQVKEILLDRFSESHEITVVQAKHRAADEWTKEIEELHKVNESILTQALNEHRSNDQQWLWMRAEQGGALNAANAS